MIKAIIFDWGDTVMRDFPDKKGPMVSWDVVELIPFIESQLEQIQNKYICCIASNAGVSDTELMKKALQRMNIEKYFNYFFTSKDLGYEKPDKRFFVIISQNIKINPNEIVMVGNDYKKDICGAKSVGMKTIFFNEKNLNGDFFDADYVIYSMKDLIPIINKINNN